jgi:DNA-binding NarL/FixJ family response regulator
VNCLTRREREVLKLLGRGQQSADISEELGVRPGTVRTHVRNLLQKLKVTSRTEAVAKYLNPVT